MSIPFNKKYNINQETNCWDWAKAISSTGYGVVWFEGRLHPAHRVSYILNKGNIEEGKEIDHLCRNRACVNPDHLEAVTKSENAHRGIGTKLTVEQVQEIYKLNSTGIGYRKLAKLFNVHRSTICHLLTKRNWKNV